MLMLGNLLKVSGVVDRLSKSAQNEIINIATLFLGLAIGATMEAGGFLSSATLKIMGLGLLAFALDTVAGLLFGKLMAVLSGYKINPLIGASGISAFPMAGRLAARWRTMKTRITTSSCTPWAQILPASWEASSRAGFCWQSF